MARLNHTIVVTDNIASTLKSIALKHRLAVKDIDFKLLTYSTKLLNHSTDEETDIDIAIPNEKLSTEILLDENITIKQYYEIEVFEKTELEIEPFKGINFTANKSFCKVFLSVKKGAVFTNVENFEELLDDEINKRKLKAGILLGLFTVPKDSSLKDLIAKIRVHEQYTVLEDKMFLVAESLEPVRQVDDKIIQHYKIKKQENKEKGSKDRGFLSDVLEDELILEYLKPKIGIPGRDCQGHYVSVALPSSKHMLTMKIGDGIQIVDEEDQIKYYSTKSGYLSLNREEFCIKNEIEVQALTFKRTGSIDANLNSEIQINVVEANYLNDAVTGINVDTKDIKVEGNVGYGANISADTIEITGQVHKSSTVQARKITIGRLKGTVKGQDVSVDLLEQGRVRGDVVRIKKAMGGIIVGREVYIDELKSNTIIIASSLIEINTVTGEDNKLIIDPYARINRHDLDMKISSISGMELELKRILKHKMVIANQLRSQSNLVKTIKKRMIELEGTRIELSSPMKLQYRKYEELVKEYKELHKKELMQEELLNKAKKEIADIGLEVDKGMVINNGRWYEHNKIIFKLAPGKELEYKPKMGEKIHKMYVNILNDKPKIITQKDKD